MHQLKSTFAIAALAAAAAAILFLGWRYATMPFQDVQLPGTLTAAEAEEVRGVVERVRDGAGVAEVAQALETLDWVRAARTRRIWPAAVRIELDLGAAAPPGVSHAAAPDGEARRLFETLNPAIADAGLTLAALDETEGGGWRVELGNGIPILLGHEALNDRLGRALAVFGDQLSGRVDRVERIDARYASGVAVRWRPEDEAEQRPMLASN